MLLGVAVVELASRGSAQVIGLAVVFGAGVDAPYVWFWWPVTLVLFGE